VADDITADLRELVTLRTTVAGLQTMADGDLRSRMDSAARQPIDFGVISEATLFGDLAYRDAVNAMETNRRNLAKLLGDLAAAAKTIHDNYASAGQNNHISAQSVQKAIQPVEDDFTQLAAQDAQAAKNGTGGTKAWGPR
jgi:hypothetical protein